MTIDKKNNIIVGRENEIAKIKNAFDDVSEDNFRVINITGVAGSGKTFLVTCCEDYFKDNKANFIQVKFSQYSINDFTTMVNIIDDIIKRVLTLPNPDFLVIKNELVNNLRDESDILCSISTFATKIFIPNKSKRNVDISNDKKNMVDAFFKFIKIASKIFFPMVLFIDDLQWIDEVSLKCIENICASNSVNILLLLAYRDNASKINQLNFLSKRVITTDRLKNIHIKNYLTAKYNKLERLSFLTDFIESASNGNAFYSVLLIEELENKRDAFAFGMIEDEEGNWVELDYSFDDSVKSNGEVVGTNFNQGGELDIMIYEGKVEDIASFVHETYWTPTGLEFRPQGGYIQGYDEIFPHIDDYNEGDIQISFSGGERFEKLEQEPAGINGEWYTEESKYVMDPVGYYIFTNVRKTERDGNEILMSDIYFAMDDKLYGLTLANDVPCSNIVEYKQRTDSTPAYDMVKSDVEKFIGDYFGSYENNSGLMKLAIRIYDYEMVEGEDYCKIKAEFHFAPNDTSSNGKSGSYSMKGILEITEGYSGYIVLDGVEWISDKPSENYNMIGLEGWIDINKGTLYGLLDRENKPDFYAEKQ